MAGCRLHGTITDVSWTLSVQTRVSLHTPHPQATAQEREPSWGEAPTPELSAHLPYMTEAAAPAPAAPVPCCPCALPKLHCDFPPCWHRACPGPHGTTTHVSAHPSAWHHPLHGLSQALDRPLQHGTRGRQEASPRPGGSPSTRGPASGQQRAHRRPAGMPFDPQGASQEGAPQPGPGHRGLFP